MDAAMPHLDAVFARARFLLRDTVDAEDAAQECYLRAMRHFGSYRGPNMRSWLFTILKNLVSTEYARRAKHPALGDRLDVEDAGLEFLWQDAPPTAESMIARRQEDNAIRRIIDALPASFREVLTLREFDELSYKEIAALIDAPIGTVMSRLARARSLLSVALRAEGLMAGRQVQPDLAPRPPEPVRR